MSGFMGAHTEWCIVRSANGRIERARDGYKSAANARRSIPAVAKAYRADGGDANATYAVGRYMVGAAVPAEGFRKY